MSMRLIVGDQEKRSTLAAELRLQSEERVNAMTHGIGFVLAIAGAIVLILRVLARADPWLIVGCSIFSVTLVAVYAASTLSHVFVRPRLRRLFRILDQGAIYLLIAGTYTPFGLRYLRTGGWLAFLGLMWIVAIFGFLSKVLFSHRVEAVAVWTYLVLGWMPVVCARALIGVVPTASLWWMLAGGLCYTAGILFLLNDVRYRYFHAVWHLSVIAGSACHFCAIYLVT